MGKSVLILALSVFIAAPAFAIFTEDFETKPFGLTGAWNHSGDVEWTGRGPGIDYVKLGSGLTGNDNSALWRSFTAPQTGEYSVSFDYRFTGLDLIPKADDKVSVQTGIANDPVFNVFEASSSVDLTGRLLSSGSWQTITTPPPVVTLEAGQTCLLQFRLNEATGLLTPITSLQIDNVSVGKVITNPAPGALLLSSIGVGFIGWVRRRQML